MDGGSIYSYDEYGHCLRGGNIDAVYIGLPNHLHSDYTGRAGRKGVHVLWEKPMAIDEAECRPMIGACNKARVKLMAARRLHFDEANLEAVKIARARKQGDLRMFTSVFSQQVVRGNVRLTEPESRGGGSVFDMGVYCINAARYLFREEPVEVIAPAASNGGARFPKTNEMTTAILKFTDERIAEFTSSFGAADVRVVRAILKSAETGKPVNLARFTRRNYPDPSQEITNPAVKPPQSVDAAPPSG